MKTNSNKIYKGFVFAGCSFTWGQGLYYYSNLPTLKEPLPNQYDKELLTDAQNMFRKTLYYPRLVSNHFNTFEITKNSNGGSEESSFDFLNIIFNVNETYKFDEIEYIIFQTSIPTRNKFFYTL